MNAWTRNIVTAMAAAVLVAGMSGTAGATNGLATTGPAATGCPLPTFGPGASYHPRVNPADFTPNVDNPLFPLVVGRTLIYSGTKDGKKALNVFHTSKATLVVDGVRTRVVEDRLYLNSVLEETTKDYYAQDRCGNVWYFGEDTATLDPQGHVISTDGSFRAGIDGAQPGVFMQAHPEIGRHFRQEWYAGHAEDQYYALDLDTAIKVPYGSFHHAVRTAEKTALEPAVLDNKWFVPGLGEVEELAVKGPLEKLVLIDVLN